MRLQNGINYIRGEAVARVANIVKTHRGFQAGVARAAVYARANRFNVDAVHFETRRSGHFTEDHQIDPHRKGSKHAVTLSGLDMSAITAGMNDVSASGMGKSESWRALYESRIAKQRMVTARADLPIYLRPIQAGYFEWTC